MHLILFKYKYFSSRILDIIFTFLITDTLISIFANRNLFLFPIRKLSFLLLNNFLFIRKLVLNQMTKSLFKQKLSPIKPGDPIDYKDVELLKKFITERGKILPRRMTGLTSKQQRDLTLAVKRARIVALLPFVNPEG